jgi:5-methylcytosine-specific restriction endonuclease McrA
MAKNNKWVDNVSVKYLWKRDRGICGICGQKVRKKYKWPDIRAASVDHIIALSNGGDHSYDNTQLSHLGCNIAKHNQLPKSKGQGLLF